MDPNQPNSGLPPAAPQPAPAPLPFAVPTTQAPVPHPSDPTPPGMLPNGGFPPNHNPYDFITKPPEAPKKALFLKPGSMMGKVILIVGGGFVLMLLIVVLSSVFSSAGNKNVAALSNIVAEQQEIIRVANLGVVDAVDAPAKNLAQTTLTTAMTEQRQLTDYLTTKKVKLDPVLVNSKKDAQTDLALAAAKQGNTYDSTYNKIMLGLLTTYANDTAKAYKTASNKTSKAILESSFKSTATIVKGYGPSETP